MQNSLDVFSKAEGCIKAYYDRLRVIEEDGHKIKLELIAKRDANYSIISEEKTNFLVQAEIVRGRIAKLANNCDYEIAKTVREEKSANERDMSHLAAVRDALKWKANQLSNALAWWENRDAWELPKVSFDGKRVFLPDNYLGPTGLAQTLPTLAALDNEMFEGLANIETCFDQLKRLSESRPDYWLKPLLVYGGPVIALFSGFSAFIGAAAKSWRLAWIPLTTCLVWTIPSIYGLWSWRKTKTLILEQENIVRDIANAQMANHVLAVRALESATELSLRKRSSEQDLAKHRILSNYRKDHAIEVARLQEIETEIKSLDQLNEEHGVYVNGVLQDADRLLSGMILRQATELERQLRELQTELDNYRDFEQLHPLGDERVFQREFDGQVRLGRATKTFPIGSTSISLTGDVLVNILGDRPILVSYENADRKLALSLIEGICLRICAEVSNDLVEFEIYDPVGLGGSLPSILPLAKLDASILRGEIVSTEQELTKRLNSARHHIGLVTQFRLGAEFESLRQYNQRAPRDAIPYRLIVLLDSPKHIQSVNRDLLSSIIQAGPKCGVHCILVSSSKQSGSYSPNQDVFSDAFLLELSVKNGSLIIPELASAGCSLILDDVLKPSFNKLALERYSKRFADSRSKYESLPTLDSRDIWAGESTQNVRVPIGKRDLENVQWFELNGQQDVHAMIVGMTGWGKSSLLHTIITGLCERYSPYELNLYLVDFKQVEFQVYADHALPHAKVIATCAPPIFGLNILKHLCDELDTRKELFKRERVASFELLRTQKNIRLPRMILFADEVSHLFEAPHHAKDANRWLAYLAREARAFGIHLVLVSQTFKGLNINQENVLSQFATRIFFNVDAKEIGFNTIRDDQVLQSIKERGKAAYVRPGGDADCVFRAYFPIGGQIKEIVDALADRQHTSAPPMLPRIFDGQSTPTIASVLRHVRKGQDRDAASKVRAIIGDSLDISVGAWVTLESRPRRNAVILGEDIVKVDSMILSIAASIVSGCLMNGLVDVPAIKVVDLVPNRVRQGMSISDRIADCLLKDYVECFERPLEPIRTVWNMLESDSGRNVAAGPKQILFILGMQYVSRTNFPDQVREQLETLLERGSSVGVHIVLWADRASSLGVTTPKGFFEHCICQEFSEDRNTWTTLGMNGIPSDCSVYYESSTERLEFFRDFVPPTSDDINAILGAVGAPGQAVTSSIGPLLN